MTIQTDATKQHIVTALVANHSGVLTRVSGLFARRGYNIESLTVSATENGKFSRMTILVNGDDYILDQVTKQLDKLVDVYNITILKSDTTVLRELLLIKVNVTAGQRSEIETICNIYKAKSVDLSPQSMILEVTGETTKLDAFVEVLRPYDIIEMARTGVTALERGTKSIKDYVDYNTLI